MNKVVDLAQKAFLTKEIKYLLLDYYRFRAYVKFGNGKIMHMYGNEHQCTYNQLLHKKLPNILLVRQKGFDDLVSYIEKRVCSKIISANIYMRFENRHSFDNVCRTYYRGKLLECKDDLIKKLDREKTLYYFIKDGRVVVTETNPDMEDFRAHFENKT